MAKTVKTVKASFRPKTKNSSSFKVKPKNKTKSSSKGLSRAEARDINRKNKVNFSKKNQDLKLRGKKINQDINSRKAAKKAGLRTPEEIELEKARLEAGVKHAAIGETIGGVTSTATSLGGAAIATKDADFGRSESSSDKRPNQIDRPSNNAGSDVNLDDIDKILGGIG